VKVDWDILVTGAWKTYVAVISGQFSFLWKRGFVVEEKKGKEVYFGICNCEVFLLKFFYCSLFLFYSYCR
jgi:hypothetical protein